MWLRVLKLVNLLPRDIPHQLTPGCWLAFPDAWLFCCGVGKSQGFLLTVVVFFGTGEASCPVLFQNLSFFAEFSKTEDAGDLIT